MAEHSLIMWLVIGALAGWLAGLFVKGAGYGLFMDILIGVLGAVLGGWVAHLVGLAASGGFLMSLIVATIGAVLLLVALRMFKQLMQ